MNRFTGWTDVDVSSKGIQEATQTMKVLKKEEDTFDMAFTSVLNRSTVWIVQDEMNLMWIGFYDFDNGGNFIAGQAYGCWIKRYLWFPPKIELPQRNSIGVLLNTPESFTPCSIVTINSLNMVIVMNTIKNLQNYAKILVTIKMINNYRSTGNWWSRLDFHRS